MKATTGGRDHIATGPASLPFPVPAEFRFEENDEYVKYGHAPFHHGGHGDPYWTPEIITQT